MEYTIQDIKHTLARCIEAVLQNKEELTEVDSRMGDGDLGSSMEKGALALRESLCAYQEDTAGPLLVQGGMAFNSAAPSTMGTLLSMALIALGRSWGKGTALTDAQVACAPRILADAIARQGGAQRGDKTVLDALYPCAEAMEDSFSRFGSLPSALQVGAQAARAGAEATRGMQAKAGRARWLGERSACIPDGGALLCALIVEQLAADIQAPPSDCAAPILKGLAAK